VYDRVNIWGNRFGVQGVSCRFFDHFNATASEPGGKKKNIHTSGTKEGQMWGCAGTRITHLTQPYGGDMKTKTSKDIPDVNQLGPNQRARRRGERAAIFDKRAEEKRVEMQRNRRLLNSTGSFDARCPWGGGHGRKTRHHPENKSKRRQPAPR